MKTLLFNPFERYAGTSSLLIGLVVLLATSVAACAGDVHLDGVIDFHLSGNSSCWVYLSESLINCACMCVFIYISGLIFSRSSIRLIDVAGTQAMARAPFLVAVLASLPVPGKKIDLFFQHQLLKQGEEVIVTNLEMTLFVFSAIITLLCAVWMIALMYKAYSVACNVKGGKAIGSFIAALVLAEISSKLLIGLLI